MNSRGVQLSGGLGKEMSNLIADGVTKIDMSGMSITRFQDAYINDRKWLDEYTHEAIVRYMNVSLICYPTSQKSNVSN